MRYKEVVKKISVPAENKIKQKQYIENGRLPVIDQGSKLIGGYSDDEEKIVKCNLPVIVFGDHTKCVKYVNFPFCAGADGIKVLKPNGDCSEKYLYYLTKYVVLKIKDHGYARHYQYVEKEEVYIPSLNEQARIVSRIEELFSELDKGVETLQIIKEQLAVYRQAVLKDAFGDLTTIKTVKVCQYITDGDHMPPPKSLSGIPFIMISNIENNKINWEHVNHVSNEYYEKIGDKRTPRRGDVLYTVTGSFGIPVMVDFDKPFCFQRHIALLRPNEKITQEFLYYALQSKDVYSQAARRATGTAQKTVGLGTLRDLDIPFCRDIVIQKKIVKHIEERLSVCNSIEQTVATALSQAEAMRHSILKKAFEGGLN